LPRSDVEFCDEGGLVFAHGSLDEVGPTNEKG